MDWSSNPLGPVEHWPQSLRTTVGLCLASSFPIAVVWGPQHTQIYNDGYWPICEGKHPGSMGQDFTVCWASAWPVIGTAFERALQGETSFLENQRMFLDRNGYLEETFFTFSFSPIRDASGEVGGLFHPVTETTAHMLGERRARALRDLAARTSEARSLAEVLDRAAQVLADSPNDVPFALLYAWNADDATACLQGLSGIAPHSTAAPAQLDLRDETACWPLGRAAGDARALQLDDVAERLQGAAAGPYEETPRSALIYPITPPGASRPAAALVAGLSPRLPLDDLYLGFCDQVAGIVTAALATALAYEQERRRAEALAEIDRAKTAFFSNVSHEFRTPLTLILGPLEDILQRPGGPGSGDQPALDLVHRNALRLLRLVNTLLDFARIEAGRLQAHPEPTDLAALTADLASVFRSTVERAGLELTVDCPTLPMPVHVDREIWEKIVLNLLSNAFKYTHAGRITVSVAARQGMAELAVADTGIGIAADELPRVFDRFHRVRGAQGRSFEGTGIGLALVRELAQQLGGSVEVGSVPAQGSVFIVRVPFGTAHLAAGLVEGGRARQPAPQVAAPFVEEAMRWLPDAPRHHDDGHDPLASSPAAPALADVPATGASHRPRVLLADDNADMRDYLYRLLSDLYTVQAVADGQAALDAALQAPFDLVLSDIMMPRLDGFGLLAALRAKPQTSETPVILLSARSGEEARVEGMQAGADDYLVKPFSARELLARVKAHLDLARMRHESVQARRAIEERASLLAQAQALQASEHRLKLALEAGNMGLWEWDITANTSIWNAQMYDLLGLPRTDGPVNTDLYFQHLHPDDLAGMQAGLTRAVEEQATSLTSDWIDEFRVVLADGRRRWVSARGRVYRDDHGKPVRMLGVNHDITEQRASMAELQAHRNRLQEMVDARTSALERTAAELAGERDRAEAANRSKSEFLANMSHEIRTPMNAIIGLTHLVQRELREPDQRDRLAKISRSAQHLLQVINDILDLSKIDAGRLQLEEIEFSLDVVLARSFEMVSDQAQSKGLELVIDTDHLPDRLIGDPTRFAQALLNLVSNAVKFTSEGWVRLGGELIASQDDRALMKFTVQDTGMGIPQDQIGALFHAFEQADTSTTRRFGGTGLGLALTQRLAHLMGGEVGVDSTPGKGSRFWFTAWMGLAKAAPPVAARELFGLRVLLVDDLPESLAALISQLQRLEMTVTTARSGAEALVAADPARTPGGSFDLLIIDWRMTPLDGAQTLALLRTRLPGGKTPAMLITAFGDAVQHPAVQAAGFDAILVKPITASTLHDALLRVLGTTGAAANQSVTQGAAE